MEFQLGETYSGYQFLDILKRSRNGIEFRVRNTRFGRLEALRALPEPAQDDQERSDRFLREMHVHASLIHPNIVTLFNVTVLENQLVMTTELVEGPTLADKLLLGPLPWAEAVAMSRQVISALAYAHQKKIVHRDINPENIVISPGGVLKLANFALAKGAASPKLTQVGMTIGNLRYISPEQIKGIGEVDARSDLYAAGMVLYEMLCGRPAFNHESQFELMAAQVHQAPSPPNEVNAAVPKEIGGVVLKALAKDPADRYQTAADFDEALVKGCRAPRSARVQPVTQAPSVPAAGGTMAAIDPQPGTPRSSGHRQAAPALEPVPAAAPPFVAWAAVRVQKPGVPAPPAVSGGLVAGPSAPAALKPWVPLRTVPDPVPSMAPVAAFLATVASVSLSRQQLIIGGTASACVGVLLVALWLFAK
ncbi:MAG: protein kinase [Acidobacteriia bacterium]|nr:protein kinase [Terriglobia bacterium]